MNGIKSGLKKSIIYLGMMIVLAFVFQLAVGRVTYHTTTIAAFMVSIALALRLQLKHVPVLSVLVVAYLGLDRQMQWFLLAGPKEKHVYSIVLNSMYYCLPVVGAVLLEKVCRKCERWIG
ncbi:hypothetical protein KDD30_18470 (plasmid) [Photobacterium sp. GJ3]|uniref:hypothetical protein n=1 Tax=Photobacterium sp. GJ3 TaxID=2829502 RepID=UPI001B8B73F8|nr:hypothetical protein [Photobacterium sp. GJ3]QUJ70126.1 hypothetical protein KDD30_18470 [Photobacterium sp. GJ3]